MKSLTNKTLILLSLFMAISCGQGHKSVDLKVSTGFAIGAQGFTGGLIAYGDGPNGARFSASAMEGMQVSMALNDGLWNIYVVGWEEPTNKKFRGTKHCGMVSTNLASTTSNIEVNVSPANCSDPAFQAAFPLNDTFISSCGAFYSYDSASDTYPSLTASTSDNFCGTLPEDLRYSFPIYKIEAINIDDNKTETRGISSECLATEAAAMNRLGLPTSKVPFRIKMYKSIHDCKATNALPVNFSFPQGIQAGNAPSFDHHFMVTTSPLARLILPSGVTRRGLSPFMNMIPRMFCDGIKDCTASPTLPALSNPFSGRARFNVNWHSNNFNDEPNLLIKNAFVSNLATSCGNDILSILNQSSHFSVDNCHIKNGHVYGQFRRNEFTCRANADLPSVVDLYEKNGFIYHVAQRGSDYRLIVYNQRGVQIDDLYLMGASGITFHSITILDDQHNYAALTSDMTATYLHVRTAGGTTTYSSSTLTYLDEAKHLEAINSDTLMVGTNSDLKLFKLSSPSAHVSVSLPSGSTHTIKKLLFKNGRFLVLDKANSTGTDYSKVYEFNYSTAPLSLTLANSGTSIYTSNTLYSSFHITSINSSSYLFLLPQDSMMEQIRMLPIANDGTISSTPVTDFWANLDNGSKLIAKDKNIYFTVGIAPATTLKALILDMTSTTTIISAQYPALDKCEAQLTGSLNGQSLTLNLRSSIFNSVDRIFNDSFRLLGIRTLPTEDHFYYFEALSERNDGEEYNPSAVGTLARIQEMLGPMAIGGAISHFYPNKTCSQIKASLPAVGETHKLQVSEPFQNQTQIYNLEVKALAENVPDFLCNTTASCTEKYDLQLTLKTPMEAVEKETTVFKIRCDQKLGLMESIESDERVNKELLLWNTQNNVSRRYENYELSEEYGRTRVTLTRAEKSSDSDLQIRSIELTSENIIGDVKLKGRVTELHRFAGSLMIASREVPYLITGTDFSGSNGDYLNGMSGPSIGQLVTNTSLKDITNENASDFCMPASNTDLGYTASSCAMPTFNGSTSEFGAIPYTLEGLKNALDTEFSGVYTLTP